MPGALRYIIFFLVQITAGTLQHNLYAKETFIFDLVTMYIRSAQN